jgi:hypothetical protein
MAPQDARTKAIVTEIRAASETRAQLITARPSGRLAAAGVRVVKDVRLRRTRRR